MAHIWLLIHQWNDSSAKGAWIKKMSHRRLDVLVIPFRSQCPQSPEIWWWSLFLVCNTLKDVGWFYQWWIGQHAGICFQAWSPIDRLIPFLHLCAIVVAHDNKRMLVCCSLSHDKYSSVSALSHHLPQSNSCTPTPLPDSWPWPWSCPCFSLNLCLIDAHRSVVEHHVMGNPIFHHSQAVILLHKLHPIFHTPRGF